MCGIAGIVSVDGFDPELLVSMTHLVRHRGPDGYGFAFFESGPGGRTEIIHNQDRLPAMQKPVMGLGHRRLAILDLSSLGSQPMSTEDGTLHIAHNGEVYNFLELRKELETLGHSFKTRTDTEVILHAYGEWGSECLDRFNGMWSFAIWDRLQQTLFCSRDRFGEKPFYYHSGPRCFVFGSEIKQILEFSDTTREANEWLVFSYLEQGLLGHSDETFFKGIYQLPAGHFLILDLVKQSLVPEIRRYWDLPIKQTDRLSAQEASKEFLRRLTKAVSLRMLSDVPVGSCLSGGLDSSAIVCVATSASSNGNFHTFSSCFDGAAFDERSYVAEVVERTRVKPHLVFPQPEQFWETLERLIWHQDEPVGSSSVFAQWCLMQAARRENIPVLLDGQGGDETLCGYLKFHYFYLLGLLKRADLRLLSEALLWSNNGSSLWSNWDEAKRYLPAFLSRNSSFTARVCQPEYRREYQDRLVSMGFVSNIPERQKADLTFYSIPVLLRYQDRNSMAHSIETRVPFLDHELATFLVNCATPLKLRHGWSKWILREALKGTLPERVRLRRHKLYFDTPQEQWMREDLREVVKGLLTSSQLRMKRFLASEKVLDEFNKFFSGRGSLSHSALFRVLALELWARVYGVS
jgi:asparagine synthase (glutamine-hydrolysing)